MKKLLLLIALSCFACKSETFTPLEKEISLVFGETVTIKDGSSKLSIQVVGIQDNRCPVNAQCVRLGEVFVDFEINGITRKLCLDCETEFNTPKSVDIQNRTYELIDVTPLPYLAQPTTQSDKVVRLSIN